MYQFSAVYQIVVVISDFRAAGCFCRHVVTFSLSYDNTITRTRRVNEYPSVKRKCGNCVWISEGQKPVAPRMRTERLKRKVSIYQVTKTKIYSNSNNALIYLIEKVRKILLICKRAVSEFPNVYFMFYFISA